MITKAHKQSDTVIKLNGLTKVYKLYSNDRQKIMATIFPSKKLAQKVANDNINLRIRQGESVAIIGDNGAGKSTLLKLITGVTHPTSGQITVRGQVGAILELTVGFDDSLTGRENIYLKGMILGLNRATITGLEKKILRFAEIDEYIDQPVRTYSSGMKARLGFAINSHINPDILIIDEALSVGDKNFQNKCRQKISEIRRQDHVTVLLVTHSAESAKTFCDRGIVLDGGKLVFDGSSEQAVDYYNQRK